MKRLLLAGAMAAFALMALPLVAAGPDYALAAPGDQGQGGVHGGNPGGAGPGDNPSDPGGAGGNAASPGGNNPSGTEGNQGQGPNTGAGNAGGSKSIPPPPPPPPCVGPNCGPGGGPGGSGPFFPTSADDTCALAWDVLHHIARLKPDEDLWKILEIEMRGNQCARTCELLAQHSEGEWTCFNVKEYYVRLDE